MYYINIGIRDLPSYMKGSESTLLHSKMHWNVLFNRKCTPYSVKFHIHLKMFYKALLSLISSMWNLSRKNELLKKIPRRSLGIINKVQTAIQMFFKCNQLQHKSYLDVDKRRLKIESNKTLQPTQNPTFTTSHMTRMFSSFYIFLIWSLSWMFLNICTIQIL